MSIKILEERLGYTFQNHTLLSLALTHRSYGNNNNERLEFLGDTVLNCAISLIIFQNFKKFDEGSLSRVRASLVKQQALYEIAQEIKLAPLLRLGDGERKSGGFRRPSILADALEAVLGAVFIDSNWETTLKIIEHLYQPLLAKIDVEAQGKDAKTSLQELLQSHYFSLPKYTLVQSTGAAHSRLFEVECIIDKLDVSAFGSGTNRRSAEQLAAKKALDIVMPMLANKLPDPHWQSPKVQLSLLGIATRQNEDF